MIAVRVTTLARTVADLFDRHDLAGGAEELFNSLDWVARVDVGALVRHAHARGNAAAVGAMGFWLERERERRGVSREALHGYGVRRRPTGHAGGKWLARYASALGGYLSLESAFGARPG